MSTQVAPRKTYEIFAILCLLIPLYIQLKWLQVYAGASSNSPEARRRYFLEEFPTFIASPLIISLISIGFSVAAIAFAQRSFNQPKLFWRISSFIIVFIAAIIVLLSIFQML